MQVSTLTFASLDGDEVLDVEQGRVVFHGEHVVVIRVTGERVQLRLVRVVADADGEHVDALGLSLGRLHLCDLRVVRLAVRDDDGDVWDVGTGSVLRREHLRAHVAQGRRRVRVAADVGDAPAAGERKGE